MSGFWSDNINEAVYNCNRLSGAFLNVYNRTAVPKCDWPISSDFMIRQTSNSGPQVVDFVAIRDRKPQTTLSPRFCGYWKVKTRLGKSIQLDDGRQINLHDCVLVGKNKAVCVAA